MNQAIHNVDLLQWLMGPVTHITGFTTMLAHERIEVEDTAVACLRFANGRWASSRPPPAFGPACPRPSPMHGDKGSAVIEQDDLLRWDFSLETTRGPAHPPTLRPEDRRQRRLEQPGRDIARRPCPAAGGFRRGHRQRPAAVGRWPGGPQGGRDHPGNLPVDEDWARGGAERVNTAIARCRLRRSDDDDAKPLLRVITLRGCDFFNKVLITLRVMTRRRRLPLGSIVDGRGCDR